LYPLNCCGAETKSPQWSEEYVTPVYTLFSSLSLSQGKQENRAGTNATGAVMREALGD